MCIRGRAERQRAKDAGGAARPALTRVCGGVEADVFQPREHARRTRERVGPNFIIIYRLSMLDLVDGGSDFAEVVQLAKAIEAAGATIINTGIGWHEARIPTIATSVPRGAFAWVTKKMKGQVQIPLITTNRINTPEVGEQILADGCADMVSMARPFLADAEFVPLPCGHQAFAEMPAEFIAAIDPFLDRVTTEEP